MVKSGKAYHYAKWCVEEAARDVPKYVKIQAWKWLEIVDGKHEYACVDEKIYEKICRLLKVMVHPDLRCSIYDGMEDYAWFFIIATLCTVFKDGSEYYKLAGVDPQKQKIRYYVTALLEIGRKNFKTFYSAVIFVLLMLT